MEPLFNSPRACRRLLLVVGFGLLGFFGDVVAGLVGGFAGGVHRAFDGVAGVIGGGGGRIGGVVGGSGGRIRSEEHTSELQSLMRNSYAVFCLKKKKNEKTHTR